jgi:hypothetical protein
LKSEARNSDTQRGSLDFGGVEVKFACVATALLCGIVVCIGGGGFQVEPLPVCAAEAPRRAAPRRSGTPKSRRRSRSRQQRDQRGKGQGPNPPVVVGREGRPEPQGRSGATSSGQGESLAPAREEAGASGLPDPVFEAGGSFRGVPSSWFW